MEIRAGLLFQKQPITAPLVHFGLGENTETDVLRIVWPNGAPQAEFDLQSDQTIAANQPKFQQLLNSFNKAAQ